MTSIPFARYDQGWLCGLAERTRRSLKEAALRTLTEVFAPGSPSLPEGLRTLVVSPERFVEPGATVRATFSFRNLGGGAAKGLRVRFAHPDGLTYLVDSARVDTQSLDGIAGVGALVQSGGAEIGDVEAGAERKISLAYVVAPTLENGTTFELQAAVSSFDLPVVGSNVVRLIVRSKPELAGVETRLSLTPVRDASPNAELIVSARVRNSGESSANDLVFALPVPVGTSYIDGSLTVDGRAIDRSGRDPLGYRHPLLANEKLGPGVTSVVQYRVRIDAPLADQSTIEARGSVASREVSEFELQPVKLVITSRASFEGDKTRFDLLTPSGHAIGDEVAAGTALLLRLHATNSGTSTAVELGIDLVLPPGLDAVDASARRDGQPMPVTRTDRGVHLHLGDLAALESSTLELLAIVGSPLPNGQTLPVQATLAWTGGARLFEPTVTVGSSPRFTSARNRIVRESPRIVEPNDRVSFAIAICNDGTTIANDTLVTIKIDDGLDDIEVIEDGVGQRMRPDGVTLGPIEPNVPRIVRVAGRIRLPFADGSEIGCRARISAAGSEPLDLREEHVTVRSRARFRPESSRLRRQVDERLRPDQTTAIAVGVHNEGNDVARDVRVALRLAPELRLESAEGATRDGQTLVFGEIGAGETREGIATIRLQPFVANGTIVTVDATLNAAAALPVVLDALSVVTRAEPRLADGAQLLTMPRDMIDAGAEIGFTLVFRNSGDGAASRIVIRGAQPPNTAYVPASTSVNGVPLLDRGGTSLLWSDDGLVLSDVTPGAEVLVRWLSIVNTPLPAQTAITARIEIASDDAAPFTVESQPIVVRSAPAFAVPSVSLPFSIAGAAASVPLGGSLDRVALEGSMRRVTPLPGAVSADRIDAQAVPAEGALPVHMRTAEPFEDEPLDQSVVLIVADFSAERIGRTLEYLEESSFGGLISHLFVLRALFPDRVSGNGSAAKALATELATLREIFDHLFVRLRMPRFRIGPKDLETERSRDATRSLFAALAQERVERLAPPAHDVTRLVGTVDKAECERFVRAIEAAPMGGAAPWHALAHLLGADLVRAEVHHDSAARYRDELISTLGAFLDRPVASFMSALGTERSAELDGALGALVQDLRPQDDEPLEAHEAASEVR